MELIRDEKIKLWDGGPVVDLLLARLG